MAVKPVARIDSFLLGQLQNSYERIQTRKMLQPIMVVARQRRVLSDIPSSPPEKLGDEPVPWVSDKRKLVSFGEKFTREIPLQIEPGEMILQRRPAQLQQTVLPRCDESVRGPQNPEHFLYRSATGLRDVNEYNASICAGGHRSPP